MVYRKILFGESPTAHEAFLAALAPEPNRQLMARLLDLTPAGGVELGVPEYSDVRLHIDDVARWSLQQVESCMVWLDDYSKDPPAMCCYFHEGIFPSAWLSWGRVE